jgi:hypothetical protein
MKDVFEGDTRIVQALSSTTSPGHYFAPVDCGGLTKSEYKGYHAQEALIKHSEHPKLKTSIPAVLKYVAKHCGGLPTPNIIELRGSEPNIDHSLWHMPGPLHEPSLWCEMALHGSHPDFVLSQDESVYPVDESGQILYLADRAAGLRNGTLSAQSREGRYLDNEHDILVSSLYTDAVPMRWTSDQKHWRYSLAFQWRLPGIVTEPHPCPVTLPLVQEWGERPAHVTYLRLPFCPDNIAAINWQTAYEVVSAAQRVDLEVSVFPVMCIIGSVVIICRVILCVFRQRMTADLHLSHHK